MYRITYVYRGLQGLLQVEGLKASPSTLECAEVLRVPWGILGYTRVTQGSPVVLGDVLSPPIRKSPPKPRYT